MKPTLIEQVEARNHVNQTAREFQLRLIEVLRDYKGKKIGKVSPYRTWIASLSSKIEEIKSQFPGFRIVFEFRFSSLSCVIDKSFPLESCLMGCFYVKKSFFVCQLEGMKIVENENFEYNYNFDCYSVHAVANAIQEVEDAQAKIDQLRSQYGEFM